MGASSLFPGKGFRQSVALLLLLTSGLVPQYLFADEPVSEKCPHVRILTRADSDLLEEPFQYLVKSPEVNQRKALRLALDALPSVVCQSVQMVAFLDATLPSSPEALAWVGRSRPSLINISAVAAGASEERLTLEMDDIPTMSAAQNEARKAAMARAWPEVIQSIVHEAYHSATHLVDSFSPDPVEPLEGHGWPAQARVAAREYVEKARLSKGLRSEWARVNEAFADAGLSGDYVDTRVGKEGEPPRGFMTVYGGRTAGEDIAEAASWAVVQPLLNASYEGVRPDISSWKIACADMQNHASANIPPDFTALYTKLSFLRDVGFISEDDLTNCAGSIRLQGTEGANGFHYLSYDDGTPLTRYTTDFTIQRDDNTFNISAWGNLNLPGGSKPAVTLLRFWVDDPGLPRGYYDIGQCNDFMPDIAATLVAPAMFRRDVQETRSQSICAFAAKVLVTSATTDHIEGAVVLQKVWKFSAPPVPEVAGLPVRVVFKYQRQQ